MEIFQQANQIMLAGIPDEEAEQFCITLEKILKNIQKETDGEAL